MILRMFCFSASGKIRAAVGKANLLVNQKFKQFEELCYEHMVRIYWNILPIISSFTDFIE